MFYASPTEAKHWIPKAQKCIKHALEELEFPEYKENPDAPGMIMSGTKSITPISYGYNLIGLASELIYKTFLVSNFKPLIMGARGHKLSEIHRELNHRTRQTIEEYSQDLVNYFGVPYTSNGDSIISQIDTVMTNANVKYNNVPERTFSQYINKNASFSALGYNRTLAIIKFMVQIAEIAYNMLGVSAHVVTNTQRICPHLSTTKEKDRDFILKECSRFMEDFEIKILNGEIFVICSEFTINQLYPHPAGSVSSSPVTLLINRINPNPFGILLPEALMNSFNSKSMQVVIRQ